MLKARGMHARQLTSQRFGERQALQREFTQVFAQVHEADFFAQQQERAAVGFAMCQGAGTADAGRFETTQQPSFACRFRNITEAAPPMPHPVPPGDTMLFLEEARKAADGYLKHMTVRVTALNSALEAQKIGGRRQAELGQRVTLLRLHFEETHHEALRAG